MTVDWIAVDWGTSAVRVWVVGSEGDVIRRARSDRGMGQLAPDAFERALLDLIEADLDTDRVTPVICCGMVGARQGWVEAPYAAVPCAPPGMAEAVRPPVSDPRISVHILPGLRQDQPADVMRGEETQIAGFLSAHADFDGVLCLPGTHAKWARISAGEVVSFRTAMTGEVFALLSGSSVLRHGLAGDGWDDAAFRAAIDDAMTAPAQLTARLFSLRAEGLLHGLEAGTARARLSGLLIGLELAAMRPYWLGQNVALIGEGGLTERYAAALTAVGAAPAVTDATRVTLAGLTRARRQMKDKT
ncbi:2-dehydro-3-deoxygalactonokinase [Salipiger sp. IMCC34102]|uniref:2-dehydro-3-deoxygalactonokinase n=1 Tax=Salipiger sp. IMCC34102 TaxID=2510647 RepID=UPI00101CF615|nr:2-dehydro-3-deoxygalactonokinase [Salipiger sp. IMCC34102]RYH00775.1 2-dehydro-3-deoxygalactonokinase [Salipiger sp. IMCC34102]